MEIEILKIYVAAGHSYFGHYGRPPGDAPVEDVEEISCIAGRGIEGDRFFDYKPDYKGQITFFSYEVYQDLCRTFGLPENLEDTRLFRRNVVVTGVDLNSLIDRDFTIGGVQSPMEGGRPGLPFGVQFRGSQECSPCEWMEAFHSGTHAALKNRGGLRAKILIDGSLRPGKYELTLDQICVSDGGRTSPFAVPSV